MIMLSFLLPKIQYHSSVCPPRPFTDAPNTSKTDMQGISKLNAMFYVSSRIY